VPAGSSGPDLEFAREQVEALMDDRCTVTRSTVTGTNRVTLQATPATPTTVATDLRCNLRRAGTSTQFDRERGGGTAKVHDHELKVPLDSPELRVDDVVTITDSRRNPALVGRPLRVVDPDASGSMSVSRLVLLERS
jgi:hypothetical protein